MVRFEVTLTNISLTISQQIHFITPIFRVSHITHTTNFLFFIHFILFSITSKQFNTKSYKYWKDQEKEEAAQRQTLKHA